MTALPLWQILLRVSQGKPLGKMNCIECFAVLEYLVERAEAGADIDEVKELAKTHLRQCPNCREQHQAQLDEIIQQGQA